MTTAKQQLGPALPTPEPVPELPHTEAAVLKGHDGPVFAVRFNFTGTYCLSCGKVLAADAKPLVVFLGTFSRGDRSAYLGLPGHLCLAGPRDQTMEPA